ncbi:hypothetical protein L1987_30592 [Smallanthus sonchifolius]|uniref:Uncharacterized protein n=1 Tax=Smallanthus sonchifolius TaxID=185202 RepID=A0ACB9I507_9ASTR|nr:hypothetical protein L1987_30592 [Smallanthus sonchifolius]
MKTIIGQLLIAIISIQLSITTSQNTDRVGLLALQRAWKDKLLEWNSGSDPCGGDWADIKCNNSRVTSIILTSMGLTGGLPMDIGQITELEYLILIGCNFIGQIPSSIGNLENLEDLSLNNILTGPIPSSVGNLKNLSWFDLSANQLTGSLTVSDGITPGQDMLTQAIHIRLGDNKLSGDIPPGLFHSEMTLRHLLLENNSFTGNIPSTLGLVQTVRLDRNSLGGDVPSNINNLTNVNEMDLSNNSFVRSNVPLWFSSLRSLTTLKMQHTNLVGELPADLFSIPQLQNVYVYPFVD